MGGLDFAHDYEQHSQERHQELGLEAQPPQGHRLLTCVYTAQPLGGPSYSLTRRQLWTESPLDTALAERLLCVVNCKIQPRRPWIPSGQARGCLVDILLGPALGELFSKSKDKFNI